MKNTIIKKIIMIFICFFSLISKINNVGAITCEYEMWSFNLKLDDSAYKPSYDNYFSNKTGVSKVSYHGTSEKDKKITVSSEFGSTPNKKTFTDKNFAKKVFKNGNAKCPTYITLDKGLNWDINEKDESSFNDALNKFFKKPKGTYPLVLVRAYESSSDINVVKTGYETVLKKAITNWTSFKNSELYKNASTSDKKAYDKKENDFKKSIEKSVVYDSIKESSLWKGYMNSAANEKELKEKQSKLNKATNEYCYLYCETTICKNSNDSACLNNCKKNEKPKCDKAYNACSSKTGTDLDNCVNEKLTEFGGSSEYINNRNEELNKLQQEITSLNNSGKKVAGLNLKFDEKIRLQCSDVVSLHKYWVVIQILGPIAVLLFGSIDLLKGIVAGDEQKIKKAKAGFPKRILAVILLVVAGTLVSIFVNISTNDDVKDTSLLRCIINGK